MRAKRRIKNPIWDKNVWVVRLPIFIPSLLTLFWWSEWSDSKKKLGGVKNPIKHLPSNGWSEKCSALTWAVSCDNCTCDRWPVSYSGRSGHTFPGAEKLTRASFSSLIVETDHCLVLEDFSWGRSIETDSWWLQDIFCHLLYVSKRIY